MKKTLLLLSFLSMCLSGLYGQTEAKHSRPYDTLDIFEFATKDYRFNVPFIYEWSLGYSLMSQNLDAFNATLPDNSRTFSNQRHNVSIGLSMIGRKMLFELAATFAPRQRSFLNDYEQFYFMQSGFTFVGGPNYTFGKKKNFHVSGLVGAGYSMYDLYYQNDSITSASSIPWIVNLPMYGQNIDEKDPNHYSNPGIMLLAKVRANVFIGRRLTLTGFVGWQQDVSKSHWEYRSGFIRKDSPATRHTGFYCGIRLGSLLY